MFRNSSMSIAGALRRASMVRRKPAADGDSASVSEERGKDVRQSRLINVERECLNVCSLSVLVCANNVCMKTSLTQSESGRETERGTDLI